MKIYRNNGFLDLRSEKIENKLDYYSQDRRFKIKQFKDELQKLDSLESKYKKCLDNITELQELSLQKIELMEKMKIAILQEHKINLHGFQFRQF